MKLKLGTKILWLQAFAVIIFMISNLIIANWLTGLFGSSVSEASPLWFIEFGFYLLWVIELLAIGGIWQLIPRKGESPT